MRLTRGAVTQAQDPARVRLRPRSRPDSLKAASTSSHQQDEILCAERTRTTRSFAHWFIRARGLCDRLFDATNNRAGELRIHRSGATEQPGSGEPCRAVDGNDLDRWSTWGGRGNPQHQTRSSTGRRPNHGFVPLFWRQFALPQSQRNWIDQRNRERKPGQPQHYDVA